MVLAKSKLDMEPLEKRPCSRETWSKAYKKIVLYLFIYSAYISMTSQLILFIYLFYIHFTLHKIQFNCFIYSAQLTETPEKEYDDDAEYDPFAHRVVEKPNS